MTGIVAVIVFLVGLLAVVELIQAARSRAPEDEDHSLDAILLQQAQAAIKARQEAEKAGEAETAEAADGQDEQPKTEELPSAPEEPTTNSPAGAPIAPVRLVVSAASGDHKLRVGRLDLQSQGLAHNTNAPIKVGTSHGAR